MNPYFRLVILLSATMRQCILEFLVFTLTPTNKVYSHSSYNLLCVIIVLSFMTAALRDHRIELVRASSQELTIRINNVSLSDEGQYTCSLFTMPVKTTKAFLTVLGDIVWFAPMLCDLVWACCACIFVTSTFQPTVLGKMTVIELHLKLQEFQQSQKSQASPTLPPRVTPSHWPARQQAVNQLPESSGSEMTRKSKVSVRCGVDCMEPRILLNTNVKAFSCCIPFLCIPWSWLGPQFNWLSASTVLLLEIYC